MVVTEKDIYMAANIFIQQHNDKALERALEKMAEFERKGDVQGRECWNQIAAVIQDTQNPKMAEGEQCH